MIQIDVLFSQTGVLLSLPEYLDALKNDIAKMCEAWYTAELEQRDMLARDTVIYLLSRSLRPKATVSILTVDKQLY